MWTACRRMLIYYRARTAYFDRFSAPVPLLCRPAPTSCLTLRSGAYDNSFSHHPWDTIVDAFFAIAIHPLLSAERLVGFAGRRGKRTDARRSQLKIGQNMQFLPNSNVLHNNFHLKLGFFFVLSHSGIPIDSVPPQRINVRISEGLIKTSKKKKVLTLGF